MSVFTRLYQVLNDPQQLSLVYGEVLRGLFQASYWTRGTIGHRRVRWADGHQARIEDADTLNSPGLYVWGAGERPLYIGITVGRKVPGSFRKRFSRYIWQKRSQCNLARDHATSLITSGNIDGFPPEIRAWYRKGYRGSTVRLEGALRFAQEGLDQVWFALLPHDNPKQIKALEDALIPVANEWNLGRHYLPLLNKSKASRGKRRR